MIEFIARLSKKERIGLFAAIAFLSLVLIDRIVITPINNRLGQLEREIKIAEKQLSADLRSIKGKETISQEHQKYMQYIKKTGSDEEEIAKMLGEIEQSARTSTLSAVDMKPQPAKTKGVYKQYSVEVEAEGDEEAFIKFLYKLNNSMQLLRAEKTRLYLKDKNSPVIKSSILITKVITA